MQTIEPKAVGFFADSAGALLLGLATANIVANCASFGFRQPYDPILMVPMQYSFWMLAAVESVAGLVCLFGQRINLKLALVFWLAAQLSYWHAPRRGMAGSLGSMGEAFGVSTHTAEWGLWVEILSPGNVYGGQPSLFTPAPSCGR